jgi:integrase
MAREHKIQIVIQDGRINARITWMENGKRKALWRSGSTKTEARDRLRQALKERESLVTSGRYGPNTKFSVIMQWYLDRYAVAPTYVDNRKVGGLRSSDSVRGYARPLIDFFGERGLSAVSYSDLESYKSLRLKGKTRRGTGRSIASVHRELALARRVFNIAEREGWLNRSPFRRGEPLISAADERRGWRVMSPEEEDRLLSVCTGKIAHLRPVIICAVDTGMRAGEMFSLRWRDVHKGFIQIPALNTKTIETRRVHVSDRLKEELKRLWDHSEKQNDDLVFGLTTVKRSFKAACLRAGVEHGEPNGLSLRCLRRTAGTRWIQAGLSREETSKLLGHSQAQTTYRHYVTADERTLDHAREITDRINQTSHPLRDAKQS